jgi:hypothetical protein
MKVFRTKGLFSLPGVVLLLLVCGVAPAEEEPRQYDIELLVFRNLVANDGGEVWRADYSDWLDAADGAAPVTARVQWLDESAWHLGRHEAALRSSAPYRPIAHFAWRQTVLDREQAKAVELPASGRRTGGAWVDGTARVAVERYLHLYLDLRLHLPQEAGGAADSELLAVPEPRFKLTEQRRMRSRELHYFDNPRFGVLALITPYEAPVSASPESETAPAGTPQP